MEFIFSLEIKKISKELKLPIILIKPKGGGIVKIDGFSIKEKEWLFGMKDLKISGDGESFRAGSMENRFFNPLDHREEILSDYKIVIKKKTDNPSLLQDIEQPLDFALRIILGCGLRLSRTRDTKTLFNNSGMGGSGRVFSCRKNRIIDAQTVTRLRNLLRLLVNSGANEHRLDLLRFLLRTTMAQLDFNITGSLFISILESIFVPEKGSEIGYRLSFRLTKSRGQNLLYQKYIKKLYGKRSVVFHGGKGDFSKEDIGFLERESCWAIEQYILKPNHFLKDKLDSILLCGVYGKKSS